MTPTLPTLPEKTRKAILLNSYLDYITPFANPFIHHTNRHYLSVRRARSPLGPLQYRTQFQSQPGSAIARYTNSPPVKSNSYIDYLKHPDIARYSKTYSRNRTYPVIVGAANTADTIPLKRPDSNDPDFIARADNKYPNLDPSVTSDELFDIFEELQEYFLKADYKTIQDIYSRRKKLYYPDTEVNPLCPYSLFTEVVTTLPEKVFKRLWETHFNPYETMPWNPTNPASDSYLIMDYYYNPYEYVNLYLDINSPIYCDCQNLAFRHQFYWNFFYENFPQSEWSFDTLFIETKLFPGFQYGFQFKTDGTNKEEILKQCHYSERNDSDPDSIKLLPKYYSLFQPQAGYFIYEISDIAKRFRQFTSNGFKPANYLPTKPKPANDKKKFRQYKFIGRFD